MGNKKNHAKKNKRQANNWRNIIKMRKRNVNISNVGLVIENDENHQKAYSKHDNLNPTEKCKQSDNESANETETEMQQEASSNNFNFDDCNGAAESSGTGAMYMDAFSNICNFDELIEVDSLASESGDTEEVHQVQQEAFSNNFNFDELIEHDYDGAGQSSGTEAIYIDAFSNICKFDELIEVDYDEVSEIGDTEEVHQNESIPIHDESDENNIDVNQEVRDECENPDNIELPEERDESENLDEANMQHPESNTLSGRRIVDIAFLFEQMKHLSRHSEGCNSEMAFRKETKLGFRSIFHFQCSNCGIFHKVQSSSKNDDKMNVNKAATVGVTSIGSGFYHMEELCAHLEIPCMSSSSFDTENKKMQEDWGKLALLHSEEALKEEMEHAIATGSVDAAGNALIAIVCDGSWAKRSYGKGFSSLSGCAAIIGFYTKKVIYFGVKNKYCNICTKSYAKFCPPNYHTCNINYVGPSSSMETEIIVEGFHACERKGVRFHKVISDGDSSVFKEISESCIYQNPDMVVEKLECVNHLFRNFRMQYGTLYKDTSFKLQYRKLIKASTGDDICKGIRSAAKHWRESNVNIIEKLENLEKDCLNAPYHYFGNHDNCDQYFCKKSTNKGSYEKIAMLKSSGIFHEILNYCNIYFASNVRSLIEDQTNNPAEEFNNVVAKYLGGKRINFSLAGSYTGRVAAAVVQYNSKGHAGSEFHKFNNINPNDSCLKMENSRIKHYAKNEAARQIKPRKKPTKDKTRTITGYGVQTLDLSEHALEAAKNVELDKLNTNQLNRVKILQDTFGQNFTFKWFEARKKLINCSCFCRIINSRGPKSYKNCLDEMLYTQKEFGNTAEIRHQRLYEKEALKMFSLGHKDEMKKTGLFIDRELSFLGASPLRLYGAESIVSVHSEKQLMKL